MRLRPFVLPILLLTGLASAASANEVACFGDPAGDPNPQIETAAKDPRCAVEDEFSRSCAFRDFIRKENRAAGAAQAKNWAAGFAKVFDPTVKFDERQSLLADLQTAATNPRFLDFIDYWDALGRPAGGNGRRPPEALQNAFGDAELEKYYRAVRAIGLLDRTGTFLAALEMLSTLPDEAGKKASLSERRDLLESLFKQGLDFKYTHSAGCRTVVAKTSNVSDGVTRFGPIYRNGERVENFPEERKKAVAASEAAVGDSRTLAGAAAKLRACGGADAAVRTTVAQTIRSCDVDLPMTVFQDNRADLPQAKRDVLLAAIAKNDCYRKSVAAGLKIQRVAIATSANTLHNTANYCLRGFERLSADRGAPSRTR